MLTSEAHQIDQYILYETTSTILSEGLKMPNRARYFTMGNALIVGVVSEIMKNIE